MNKLIFVLIFSILFLSACTQIKEKDFFGDWIINTATFNGNQIVMASKTIKMYMLPTDYKNKFTITFNSDSTVDFPGIDTEDVPCRWLIKDNKLVISFDTLKFKNEALSQIDSLGTQTMLNHDLSLKKKYLFKYDSILKTRNIEVFKNPINIYLGAYTIDKTNDRLIISSPTTQFELINLNKAFKKELDNMF